MKTAFIISMFLVHGLMAADPARTPTLQEQLIPLAKEARELRTQHGKEVAGKLTALVGRCEKLNPGPEGSDENRLLYLSFVAEMQSINGQYDQSNESFAKAFAIRPDFGFYRRMVLNMRLKGDLAAAEGLVKEYGEILLKQFPGKDHTLRRQDLLQFVESALTSELTE